MKKLKKLSDVPGWFDIKKYDKASSLGPEEWHEQIRVRAAIPEDLNLNIDESDPDDCDTRIWRWLNRIKIDPIFEKQEIIVTDDFKDKETRDVVDYLSVSDLSWINLANTINADKGLIAYCNNSRDSNISLKDLSKPIQLIGQIKSWTYPNQVALTVNLEASNEQLYDALIARVEQARKDFNYKASEKMFTENDYKDWHKYAILPYFDLTTWAKSRNSEFTQAVLALTIFPNAGHLGFGAEDRLKRETIRRAAAVFNRNTCKVIEAQVKKGAKK